MPRSSDPPTHPKPEILTETEAGLVRYREVIENLASQLTPAIAPSGIVHRSVKTFYSIRRLDGTNVQRLALSQLAWESYLGDLLRGVVPGSAPSEEMPTEETIRQRVVESVGRGVVPISLTNIRYHQPTRHAVRQLISAMRGEQEPPAPSAELLGERHCFMAAALLPHQPDLFSLPEPIHPGHSIRFRLDPDLYISNLPQLPDRVRIDFGDGEGFRDLDLGDEVDVHLSRCAGAAEPCTSSILVECHYGDETFWHEILFRHGRVAGPPPDRTYPIEASIAYKGKKNKGTAYVYYGSTNGVKHTELERPVIVSEGFPGGYSPERLYDLLNQQDVLTTLLARGYDAVILGYDEGTDYVQRNGLVAVACIETINATKVTDEPLIVGGASMGGLLTRYALVYMEANGLEHHASTFLSFDAPQWGANVPPSVQWFLFALDAAGELDSAQREQLKQLTSLAARQMLYYRIPGLEDGSLVDPLHTELWEELERLGGYPRKTKNIGVACGSGNGVPVTQAGGRGVNWYGNLCVNGEAHSLPNPMSDYVDLAELFIATKINARIKVRNVYNYDGAPGGQADVFGVLGLALFESGYGWVENQDEKDCESTSTCKGIFWKNAFIPTISALNITNTTNPFEVIPKEGAATPFEPYFVSSTNLDHVEISSEIADFLLAEFKGDR